MTIPTASNMPLEGSLPSGTELAAALSSLILSASGWRKVFTASGEEEDPTAEIGKANGVLAAHMANVFCDYLSETLTRGTTPPRVVLAMDTRPTGPALGDIISRVILARGFVLAYLGVAAAPEVMSYARTQDAFIYISASHNPLGHNGVKFGLSDGGVLEGTKARKLIAAFQKALGDPLAAQTAQNLLSSCPADSLDRALSRMSSVKQEAIKTYAAFTQEVVSGFAEVDKQNSFFDSLRSGAAGLAQAGYPVSLVADFNGSARAASIDRGFFESLGFSFSAINEVPGRIIHRIVPEGSSLDWCAGEIERLRKEGRSPGEQNALLGYMPDCDGDRGNIVFWNEETKRAQPLEAQDVFALSVIAELAHLASEGTIACEGGKPAVPPAAVAVNDPTSLRIEHIARAFGAQVFRAEVGEANVVNLARELRTQGYIVRILGEGSNGGNITHPAAVRDPINTLCAILKLLVLRGEKGLFKTWCSLSGQISLYRENFTLADILRTLPAYATTSVYEKEAMLKVSTMDHGTLKGRFQAVFLREWESKKDYLASTWNLHSWEGIANNGTVQQNKLQDFSLSGRGGLKVQFYDQEGIPQGYIWMRGSGTEPVFRILADSRGADARRERFLLQWLADMVLEADR